MASDDDDPKSLESLRQRWNNIAGVILIPLLGVFVAFLLGWPQYLLSSREVANLPIVAVSGTYGPYEPLGNVLSNIPRKGFIRCLVFNAGTTTIENLAIDLGDNGGTFVVSDVRKPQQPQTHSGRIELGNLGVGDDFEIHIWTEKELDSKESQAVLVTFEGDKIHMFPGKRDGNSFWISNLVATAVLIALSVAFFIFSNRKANRLMSNIQDLSSLCNRKDLEIHELELRLQKSTSEHYETKRQFEIIREQASQVASQNDKLELDLQLFRKALVPKPLTLPEVSIPKISTTPRALTPSEINALNKLPSSGAALRASSPFDLLNKRS